MRRHWPIASLVAGCLFLPAASRAQTAPPPGIDTAAVRTLFQEAVALTARDSGRLWGRSLQGPLLIVDPATRTVLADSPDLAELLHPLGGLFTGTLPQSENAANTRFNWGGRAWAMIMWPPPASSRDRAVLLTHELWHRIQDSLGFPASDRANPHLATRDGRLWLRLEGRALRRALDASGAARIRALRDAIIFRRHRHALFPGSDSTERLLEMNEGLAEYTGVMVAATDSAMLRDLVSERLAALDTLTRMERVFAYQTGPAYGFFLDQLAPGWRSWLRVSDDLSRLLVWAVRGGAPEGQATARAAVYRSGVMRREETTRETRRKSRQVELRKRFVQGPVLELPLSDMKLGFDPRQVESMDSVGIVYGNLRLTDTWGVLQCDASGGLISFDWHRLIVPAPADTAGRRLTGPGWVLELAPEWRIVPGTRRGDWAVVRQ